MNFSKNFIKNLLKKYKIKPSKCLGQNFLIDKIVLRKILKAANLSKNDIILEIGPGIGNLTVELAKRVKKVIAVEKDKKMIEVLKDNLKNFKNVKIIQGDILKSNIQYPISNIQYKVVANLPYYIVSPIIRKFLESKNPPKEMLLMVQKEVAQRITVSEKMNLLAVSVQFYAESEIISYVSKKSFWPSPKVDSAIIKIAPFPYKSTLIRINPRLFFRVLRAGFSHPRKKALRNLEKELKLNKEKLEKIFLKNKIDFNSRAENLTLKNWLCLAKALKGC